MAPKLNPKTGGYDDAETGTTGLQEGAEYDKLSNAYYASPEQRMKGFTGAAPAGGGATGGGAAAPSVSPSMAGFQTAGVAPEAMPMDALNGGGAAPLRNDLGTRTPASLQSLLTGRMY